MYISGLIFWTDWHHPRSVRRCDLSGSNYKVIYSKSSLFPTHLRSDPVEKKLYFVDDGDGMLMVMNYEGKEVKVIREIKDRQVSFE